MKKFLIFLFVFFQGMVADAQRNVILIIADDLGTDYCGFYEDHGDTAALPHLRTLLQDGVRFTNAMSNPVCSATRSGILTGRYSFRTGVGNIVGSTAGSGQLDVNEKTIPGLLKNFNPGISTALIGKWHLQNPVPASNLQNPNLMGFDHFEGPFIGSIPNYYNWTKYVNGIPAAVTNYATSENINNAVDWIKTQGSQPFFLWMAFNAPHSPYHLPPSGMYSDTTLTGTTQDINTNPKKYFKASLEALDYEIGRLMDSLQVLNLIDSTDFIFIGDNGNTPQTAQIANASRAKGTIYQYGVHVPFFISGPSVVDPGRESAALINTQDIFATVLELFGDNQWLGQLPANTIVDSKSLLPIITNQAIQIRPWAFTENFKSIPDTADGKAIRNEEYKLLNFDLNGHQEFYHLTTDSLELNNLLTGSLTSVELSNYTTLCSEMTNLVGAGTYCYTNVGIPINEQILNSPRLYPMPFESHISISDSFEEENYELRNVNGGLIYRGREIQTIDFSYLNPGIYILRFLDRQGMVKRVVKI